MKFLEIIILTMKRIYKICAKVLAVTVIIVIVCNLIVLLVSDGQCYKNINAIPHHTFGLLLGTGRDSAPSPYYDARVQAAIDLYRAGKIDYVIISGENLYPDYHEVDSMALAMQKAEVPIASIDYHGTNTYKSLSAIGNTFGHSIDITIISQQFHNQRAIYYGSLLFNETPIGFDAKDTDIWYWKVWQVTRELLARTKAVLAIP